MKIMVNTTFAIDGGIREEFLCWLRQRFIPEAISKGAANIVVSRVIGQMLDAMPSYDEAEAYACQFQFASRETAARWSDHMSASVIADAHAAWGDRLLPFTTFMELVEV